MRFRHVLFILFVSLALVAGLQPPARAGGGAPRGQSGLMTAPDFSLVQYSDGRTFSLTDARDKVVLLFFFFPT